MAESSGELLGGRYRLLGERTAFPFGAWWEAEDDQGARTVVLRMNAEVADPAAKANAAVAATANLDPAHIVAWVDGGVDAQGHGWLAAPMFGPWSLTEHVSRGEGIPPAEAAPLMHQAARAIATGEAAGLVHNTLSSEFVRLVPLTEGGYGVKVYGYGLSDLLPSYKPLRKQDAYLGVPDYMSPELCSGKAAEGSSADVYALGIIMYEAVRGRPPFAPTFASASASTTLKRHIFEKPLPLHVRYANAPFIKTYENICFKALAKTANRRQLNVAELEKELEQLVVEEMRISVVSLASLSGRGPSTSRRLRTQVIAQIPIEEPRIEVKAAAPEPAVRVEAPRAVVSVAPVAVAQAPVQQAQAPYAEPVVQPVIAAATRAPAESEEREEAPIAARKGDSTIVFAGLGPAVRELAEAARKADDEEENAEEEAEQAGAAAGATSLVKGKKKKKGRKSQTGLPVVSHVAPTERADRPGKPTPVTGSTTPASATVVTARADAATGEAAGAAAGVRGEPSGARIRKRDEQTSPAPLKGAPARSKDDQEEWFGEEDGRKKSSRAWILLLLAAAVVVVVVILLMSGSNNDAPPVGSSNVPATPTTRYPLGEEPMPVEPATAAATPTPAPTVAAVIEAPEVEVEPKPEPKVEPALTATTPPPTAPPAVVTPPEPPKPAVTTKVETPKVETPPKTETPPRTETPPKTEVPPKVETPARVEPTRVETPVRLDTPKTEPKLEPARVETPPKIEPAKEPKVDAPPVKPATVETEQPKDPPGSPEDQFRAKAKHYIELGVQAYKSENYKLAIGYFKKAQEADPSNTQAARYLKQAQEKSQQ